MLEVTVLGTQPPTLHSTTRWPDLSEQETRDRGAIAYRMEAVLDPKENSARRPRCDAALPQRRTSHLILWSHRRG